MCSPTNPSVSIDQKRTVHWFFFLPVQTEHVDHGSQHQFTKEDLHKLIIKASSDLEELDKKRREEFKQYEMEKEFQYQESLKNMTNEQKADAVKRHDEQTKKHREHPRVHHPGSKAVSALT